MNLPRITNPREVPVAGADAHLPPVSPAVLVASALRGRFANMGLWEPEHAGDGRIRGNRPKA